MAMGVPAPAIDRFAEKYVVDANGCWLWQGFLKENGYGEFYPTRNRHMYAHRWSYEHFRGAIPEGLHIDHLCRVRHCVNPDHLEAVTLQENHRRVPRHTFGAKLEPFCRRGHPRTEEHVRVRGDGTRECRTCKRITENARRRRILAADFKPHGVVQPTVHIGMSDEEFNRRFGSLMRSQQAVGGLA